MRFLVLLSWLVTSSVATPTIVRWDASEDVTVHYRVEIHDTFEDVTRSYELKPVKDSTGRKIIDRTPSILEVDLDPERWYEIRVYIRRYGQLGEPAVATYGVVPDPEGPPDPEPIVFDPPKEKEPDPPAPSPDPVTITRISALSIAQTDRGVMAVGDDGRVYLFAEDLLKWIPLPWIDTDE